MSSFFAEPSVLLMGGLTGLIFGFLLQRGGVTRFDVILGQFLLRDFTVLKVMMTAMIVGAVGIYGMRAVGMDVPLHVKNATIIGNVIGGLIFGVGMAVLGYCPGTAIAAIGDGSRHAFAGVLGMLVGAGIYAEVHPWMTKTLLSFDMGKATLDSVTGLSPWWFIAGLAIIAAAGLLMLERWEHRGNEPHRHAHPAT